MNEQEMREAMHNGQMTMCKLIEECDLKHGDPLMKIAEKISKILLDIAVDHVVAAGLATKDGLSGDGAKVVVLATHAAAISAGIVGRIAKEAGSEEEATEVLKLAKKIQNEEEQKGERH